MKKLIIASIIALLSIISARSAKAEMYGFERITNNGNTNVESQFFVNVTSIGSHVLFTFSNNGPIASVITEIYFYGNNYSAAIPVLDSFDSFIYPDAPAVVDFEQDISPDSLPGLPGSPNAKFEADATNPSPKKGVNVGEELGILYNMASYKTINDVINEINNGNLIFGMHVQAIDPTGGSDSFVNDGPVVPAPAAVLLGIFGIGFAGIKLRKFA